MRLPKMAAVLCKKAITLTSNTDPLFQMILISLAANDPAAMGANPKRCVKKPIIEFYR